MSRSEEVSTSTTDKDSTGRRPGLRDPDSSLPVLPTLGGRPGTRLGVRGVTDEKEGVWEKVHLYR